MHRMLSSARIHCRLLAVGMPVRRRIVAPAIAADASPWDDDLQSAARLIAAQRARRRRGACLRAGVEIKLKPGWKTYWRYPGDSGVPPAFDFSESRKRQIGDGAVAGADAFPDGAGGNSIGYKGDVILPLRVVPQDAGKPVTLRLKLDYAVCEKLCVPAEAKLELALTGADERATTPRSPRPKRACRSRPRSATAERLAIRAVRREAGSGKPRVVVDVARPPARRSICSPKARPPQWALPLPEPVAGAPAGLQRFAFELDGLPPGAKPDGAHAAAHAVAGDKAIEAAFRLD